MKKLLIPALLLAAASSYGALSTPTADQLTDYTNWFKDPFGVAADGTYGGAPSPSAGTPAGGSINTPDRQWSNLGWQQNWGSTAISASGNPFLNTNSQYNLIVEVIFLGETAGWWDDFGYTKNGTDTLLADGVQAAGATPNRFFGDNAFLTLAPGESLDLFVTGSGVKKQDDIVTVGGQGGKYYVDNILNNKPTYATDQSYWGVITALTSVQGSSHLGAYTVVSFEDTNPKSKPDSDFNDFIFAYRTYLDIPQGGGVPEPSTYGMIGAAALLGLVGYRRFKKAKA